MSQFPRRDAADAVLPTITDVPVAATDADALDNIDGETDPVRRDDLDASLCSAAWYATRGRKPNTGSVPTTTLRLPLADVENMAKRNTLRIRMRDGEGPYSSKAGDTPERRALLEAFPINKEHCVE